MTAIRPLHCIPAREGMRVRFTSRLALGPGHAKVQVHVPVRCPIRGIVRTMCVAFVGTPEVWR